MEIERQDVFNVADELIKLHVLLRQATGTTQGSIRATDYNSIFANLFGVTLPTQKAFRNISVQRQKPK